MPFCAIPAASQAAARSRKNAVTSASTSAYCGSCCMVRGSPCMCIRHTGTPSSLAACKAPSARSAFTSLINPAPAATAARITPGLLVSMEIGAAKRALIASITGTTRSISSCSPTARAPGRVDSPPISSISAPSASICSACRKAPSRRSNRPPSEKESGVTFRMPITRGAEKSGKVGVSSDMKANKKAGKQLPGPF